MNEGPFAAIFTGVERINLAIKGLRTYGNVTDDADMRYLLGEALTLRAVFYADLMKAYGEVPARFEPVTPETIYLNKSDRDVIYKQILGDLEEAIPYLVWPGANAATASTGRMSRAFAEGLYARLQDIRKQDREQWRSSCRDHALRNFDKQLALGEYLKLYESLS